MSKNKPFYKYWVFWVLMVIVLFYGCVSMSNTSINDLPRTSTLLKDFATTEEQIKEPAEESETLDSKEAELELLYLLSEMQSAEMVSTWETGGIDDELFNVYFYPEAWYTATIQEKRATLTTLGEYNKAIGRDSLIIKDAYTGKDLGRYSSYVGRPDVY